MLKYELVKLLYNEIDNGDKDIHVYSDNLSLII